MADGISARPDHWACDQLRNHAVRGCVPLGEEIRAQTGGAVDAFVHAVSTAHSIHGVTQALRAKNRNVQIEAVEPPESAVLSGRPRGRTRSKGSASASSRRSGSRSS